VQEEDDDSDESDGDESNLPLIGAADLDVEIELEPELSNLSSLSSSRCSSNPRAVPSSTTPSSSNDKSSSNPATPFKSIISTRRQKAMAVSPSGDAQQLVTPPLTDDSASLADTSVSYPKRITRSSASASPAKIVKNNGRGEKSPFSPSRTPSKDKNKEKEKDVKVKGEPEMRILRARPPLPPNPADAPKAPSGKPEVPRDADGKLLPTCITCSSILPVISVDSKVVWGLELEGTTRKGKRRMIWDCPRFVFLLA
jgi:histone-lysine N-methyltransferase SUV420H